MKDFMDLWNNTYFEIIEMRDSDPEITQNRFMLDQDKTNEILKLVLPVYANQNLFKTPELKQINIDIFMSHIINLYNNCMLKPDRVVEII
jgi:hypothetical protein